MQCSSLAAVKWVLFYCLLLLWFLDEHILSLWKIKDKYLESRESIHSGKSEWAGEMMESSMQGNECCYGNQTIL